jgi:ATP-dependent Lhr-like helicase
LSAAARAWFSESFPGPTEVQARGWQEISAGEHTLMLAPTGSGKTLAAFLWCLDRLHALEPDAPPGVRLVYVSPLKALVYDIERNLRAPLAGLRRTAERLGLTPREVRVDVRTGDTPQRDRQRQKRRPADVLVTTPESLYLMLSSQARETLRTVQWVIVDEIHAVAASKRGTHLALSLERLGELAQSEPQRVGLSATQRPLETIARFLGGDRPVSIVDAGREPLLDLRIVVPVDDMEAPELTPPEDEGGPLLATAPPRRRAGFGMWPHIYPEVVELVRAHRSTIVFVNSRVLSERLVHRVNELAEEELVLAHHGSLSHTRRADVEERLKAGRVKGIIATSSLELGIDMGAVDLVIQIESPGAVARGLQRTGRAGHAVGETSVARIFPKYRGDLLEAAVCARGMLRGEVEATRPPARCLDVLAQHIVSMCLERPWTVEELERTVRRASPYRDLPPEALTAVLDMLSGRYPSDAFSDLRPALSWDRSEDTLAARGRARSLVLMNPGTIPDRGAYAVHAGVDGPRIGELDEEMVYETRKGDVFVLGASSWRVIEITRDRVAVEPAPGEPGKLPFWKGTGPGRPIELGRALGSFCRRLAELPSSQAQGWLRGETPLDPLAAQNLVDYVRDQVEATGCVPSDRAVVIERFRDELGDWRVCLLSPFGSRVHAPWALALEARLAGEAGHEVQTLWSDDGIVLRFADTAALPDTGHLIPRADAVTALVTEQLRHSALFAAHFRENAARALLMPRRRPRARNPLWAQRIKAETLLASAARFPNFPIVLETYRECLQDVFDLPALREVLSDIERGRIQVIDVETPCASPFARSLTFAYIAAYMYASDAPLAERRAQALSLDRELLRELLGQEELRELLDPAVLDEVEAELQCLTETRRAGDADALHDVLRRLGDLDEEELAARTTGDPAPWLAGLERARRAARIRIAGQERWIACQDAARYRDALGCVPPAGLPAALLEPVPDALHSLVARYARTRGPFLPAAPARRYGLRVQQVERALCALEERGAVVHGELRPGGTRREWCDAEVLRRIRRRTLARLRREVEPVEAAVFTRFLCAWHGVDRAVRSRDRLREVISMLEGVALPLSVLERQVLPARVPDFHRRMLDELGQRGEIVWVGCGAMGARDGRVALYLRERVATLLEPPPAWDGESEVARRVLEHLETRGASFLRDLRRALGDTSEAALQAALRELVWAGQVTNDGFAPLRAAAAGFKRGRSRDGRGRRRGPSPWESGRWVAVRSLTDPDVRATARAHARAVALLERYGVVARATAAAEALEGGFSAVYPVLRSMEEAGRARRGHFVSGLDGAQFALPGAVDRLRAQREATAVQALVLSAMDPANPYGSLLRWPGYDRAEADTAAGSSPRRLSGAEVALVNGAPVLYLTRGRRSATPLPAADDPATLAAAISALADAARAATRNVYLEEIGGEPAHESALAPTFQQAGFTRDVRGLSLFV